MHVNRLSSGTKKVMLAIIAIVLLAVLAYTYHDAGVAQTQNKHISLDSPVSFPADI